MMRPCPICRKPTDSERNPEFPFCSERCRLLDLGNWSSEKYVVSEALMDESLPEHAERNGVKPESDDHEN
jgi:uncharacterized protein